MKQPYSKKPAEQKIALERIQTLFQQANKTCKEDQQLANRYVQLARKISTKFKVRIPSSLKKQFCKHCSSYLKQGINCTVRLHNRRVIYTCNNCKQVMRFPYIQEQKARYKAHPC
ncbi:MAG: ribonuclease P [Candidatus Woesearchaeota archaeon]